MFTTGVGSIADLPNFSVLVRGLDDWNYDAVPEWEPIVEPRLLAAVRTLLRARSIKELRPAPWMEDSGQQFNSQAAKIGVPITPFPGWLRCTACDELAPIDGGVFDFENSKARKPHEARFFHAVCGRKKTGRRPMAVAARFVLACTAGHLDDFPYAQFVHEGGDCPNASHPKLRMDDRGGNLGANVEIKCVPCGARRNMKAVLGQRGADKLPRCRGRRAHLGDFEQGECTGELKLLVVGASNQWFAQTLSALAVPRTGASELQTKVEQNWGVLQQISMEMMLPFARQNVSALRDFTKWTDAQIWAAIERHRAKADGEEETTEGYPDLHTPEWQIFSAGELPPPSDDFTLRRDPDGVPAQLKEVYADVIQAERLREVRALVGFTRLDAPDPMDPDLVQRAALAKGTTEWVPASEVRGEGIFLRLPEDLLVEWEERVTDTEAMETHREAYGRFRESRYSGRIGGGFDRMRHWPGERYLALHTLSHLLIRTIALECGYSSASLSERIYTSTPDDPRSGILIYTAVPDAEGTLGGLVSLAEPDALVRLTRRALTDAMHCSSDPLCAERLPHHPEEFLHGAACHVCLFVSETTCERGNRFLDRRFVVPIDDPALALFPETP